VDNHEGARSEDLNRSAPERPTAETPDENLTIGQWLSRNGPMLLLMGALMFYLIAKFDGDWLWSLAKAALGLGFVIFIHELGHFLVAKWCDVHVQTFSIGFGPALPGCSIQWGETTYKLALFPLGGYVQMVGQVDGHEESDGSEDDPRSYKNKTVWQRMAIISAGVIMNAILAVVCFILVFQGPGKDRKAAIVNVVDSGAPAFIQGLPTGAVITRIGDVEHPYFEDLMAVVMASQTGQQLPLTYQVGDRQPVTVMIEPRLGKGDTRPLIGIQPPPRLQFEEKRYFSNGFPHPAMPGGPADLAQPPFEFGDTIVATTDPDQQGTYDLKKVVDLPPDPRKPGSGQRDYFEFSRRMQLLAGKSVVIRVLRGSGDRQQTVDVTVPPAFHLTLGTRMQMGQVTAVRHHSPGAEAGVKASDPNRSLNGDIIERVELPEPDGKVTQYDKDADLDPLRLPGQLRQWADRWARSAREQGKPLDASKLIVTLHVLRHSPDRRQQDEAKVLRVKWDPNWRFDRDASFSPASPLAIAELGIAYQVKTTVVGVDAAQAGEANPFQPGDVIKKVRLHYVGVEDGKEKEEDGPWVDVEPEQWAWAFGSFQSSGTIRRVTVAVERNKEIKEFTLTAQADPTWPLSERGLILAPDLRRQKADNFMDAVALGLKDTKNSMIQVFQNLRGIFTGRISVKNLGGPVTIARIAFHFAGVDFWEFVFFLGLISINLAVINFLPIPVLDGGHMVFLLYEKIRGKPASEQVRVGATYAGLLLLACVMVFVLYLDISRLFH
jgi:regulator of sigma E protease